ncbi:MAG: extracellular solute-binding protein [Chloroflexi bacterium]|nr:extracellular solute-binding protein [Chloroflexota bacterium]
MLKQMIIWLVTVFAPMVFVTLACSPVTPAAPVSPGEQKRIQPEKNSPGQDWDKLVAEARNEGAVVVATSNGPIFTATLAEAFRKKYGIRLEFIVGRSEELVPKVQAERRAGIYSTDVFITGSSSVVPVFGPDGALQSLDAMLKLPEVLDKKAWWGGDLLWVGPEHFQVMFLAMPGQTVWANRDLVKPGAIKSYYDLLDPAWKGKISLRDPTTAGSGNAFFTFVAETFPNGLDYLRSLGRQEPPFTRDPRLQTEWVARGKYPVAIGSKIDIAKEFIQAGAPVVAVPMAEGTYLTGSGGGVAVVSKAPHPRAATVFVNWLLGKEGQLVASEAYGGQSAREDIATSFFEPYEVRQPGTKYQNQVQQDEAIGRKYRKLAGEMYANLLK